MKYLVASLGLLAACGGPPTLPVGLPPPEYERPRVPSLDSAGAPTAGGSGGAGLGGAGASAGTAGSAAGAPAGGSP